MAAWLRRCFGIDVHCMLVRPLAGGRAPLPGASGLRFALLEEKDLRPHCADPGTFLHPARVRAACANGEVCVGALDGDGLAGYIWHAYAPAPHVDGIQVAFGPRARYAYKLWVRRSHRGRGIARELIARSAAMCPDRGRTIGVSFVAPDNHASLRAFAAAGWRHAGYAGYVRCLGAFVGFASPGARRLGARFAYGRRAPAVRMEAWMQTPGSSA